MKTLIEVEITKIHIEDYYFSFHFKITINNELKKEDDYESDHDWKDEKKDFRKLLKQGHAVKLALEQLD